MKQLKRVLAKTLDTLLRGEYNEHIQNKRSKNEITREQQKVKTTESDSSPRW